VGEIVNDLTLVYYTANKLPDFFANNVRNELVKVTGNAIPIVSVSQKPIDFGFNICVGNIGASAYNVYKQVLIGARQADTKFIACCEDDTLYSAEHFTIRPPEDTFYYNINRWIMEGWGAFRYRNRTTMCGCVVARDFLVSTLELRFSKYPTDPVGTPFGEPGRVEHHFGLPVPKLHYFRTVSPIVTFNHNFGLSRPRRRNPLDIIQTELSPFGEATALWKRIHG
jgi:hypothetical protein